MALTKLPGLSQAVTAPLGFCIACWPWAHCSFTNGQDLVQLPAEQQHRTSWIPTGSRFQYILEGEKLVHIGVGSQGRTDRPYDMGIVVAWLFVL